MKVLDSFLTVLDLKQFPKIDALEIIRKIQKHQQEQAKAQAAAASAALNLPKYYNPANVNALKLAERQEKRKLLWSKKENDDVSPRFITHYYRTGKHYTDVRR